MPRISLAFFGQFRKPLCSLVYHMIIEAFWNGSVSDWLGGLSGDR